MARPRSRCWNAQFARAVAATLALLLSNCADLDDQYEEPPAARTEVAPARPGFVWVHGHWARRGTLWTWIDGHYERERPGYIYVEGRWQREGSYFEWIEGGWQPVAATR